MATAETKLSMKLLIDTKAKKVLLAEVEKDFVDFLFHILSLPVGTVTKLLKEKGMNGCLPNLYESVENMNDIYIQSSKDIILKPECPFRISSLPLQLLNDVPTQRAVYECPGGCSNASDDPSAVCPNCGCYISSKLNYVAPPVVKGAGAAKGGFVKEVMKYMVMDDLVVEPVSVVSSITGLNKYFNVTDVAALHEEVVHFGKEEALKLLKSSFESKAVLTSVFLSPVKTEK